MIYERPKKRPRAEPAREQQPETITVSKRKRSAWRFLFTTPNKPPQAPEEAPAKRPRKRRLFLKTLSALVALALAAAAILYLLPPGAFKHRNKYDYMASNSLPSGYTHVLLIGIDRDKEGTSRSDTMIILSVGRGKLKLTSLMRDTGVSIPGVSGTHRLNAAYAYGGAQLLVKTVNQAFGTNITRYALADYDSFPKVIDLLGGVKLDVTEAERTHINNNLAELLYSRYARGETTYAQGQAQFYAEALNASGADTHLTGLQALSYARIRKLDSDYGRTNRQRKLLSAAAKSLKGYLFRPISLVNIALNAMTLVDTNMSALEMLSLGEKALLAETPPQTSRLPVANSYADDGGMFYNVDFAKNRQAFIDFVYDD